MQMTILLNLWYLDEVPTTHVYSANPACSATHVYSANHVYSATLIGLEEGQLGEEPGGRGEPGLSPSHRQVAADDGRVCGGGGGRKRTAEHSVATGGTNESCLSQGESLLQVFCNPLEGTARPLFANFVKSYTLL